MKNKFKIYAYAKTEIQTHFSVLAVILRMNHWYILVKYQITAVE